MTKESKKVHYTLQQINEVTLNSGKSSREISMELFASLLVIVDLQQKQIDRLEECLSQSQ
jgi:hypothetical protein